jgi:uncharacterized membrane protein
MSARQSVGSAEGHLNVVISRVLRVGMVLAIVILILGVILAAAGSGSPVPRRTSFADIPGALWHLEAGGFFSLGLVVLLLTPVARVIALLLAFARDRRWLFAGFSLFVLVMLVASAVLGLSLG